MEGWLGEMPEKEYRELLTKPVWGPWLFFYVMDKVESFFSLLEENVRVDSINRVGRELLSPFPDEELFAMIAILKWLKSVNANTADLITKEIQRRQETPTGDV